MQKFRKNIKIGRRDTGQQQALLRSLAVGLFEHGAITTTLPKAKVLRPFAERLVTLARVDTIASRRIVTARMGGNEKAVTTLFKQIAPQYVGRPGGYLRITKLGYRRSDSAVMAQIEFVK